MKQKKCKICKQPFTPVKPLQSICTGNNYKCATEHAQNQRDKKTAKDKTNAARELKQAKEAIKSRSDVIKEVQTIVNAFVRKRDFGLPCISCGKPTKPGDHAGHYRPTTHAPTRFDEQNINLQCVQCNVFYHGNVANYRLGLITKIGLDSVLEIESNHPPAKWTIQELKELKRLYKSKLKELKA